MEEGIVFINDGIGSKSLEMFSILTVVVSGISGTSLINNGKKKKKFINHDCFVLLYMKF